ncbi:MAG TPA: ROK family protein [Acidobacteriaceae bacterium]|jgi:glucokinase|nr:ROK family protein [Acidobacteriaceae bacterium]
MVNINVAILFCSLILQPMRNAQESQGIASTSLRQNAMRDVVAGVDAGGTRIKIGLVETSGRVISSEILRTADCTDAESFLNLVVDNIRALARAASVQVTAVGIGCPGRVDFTSGKVLWLKSKLEFLEGVSLAEKLGERLACPVICDNDTNVILTGEVRYGAARGYRDVIAISVGTGIGGALLIGGSMVRGHNWATGHFGYMSLNPLGPKHVCGNTGIFEEHVSQSGIQRQVRKALDAGEASQLTRYLAHGKAPEMQELFDAAEVGDPLGSRLVEHLISELGVLIANLVYTLDPQLVLLGGGVLTHRPGILDVIQRQVVGRLDCLSPGTTEILLMTLGDAAGILGGAALAMDAIHQTQQG